MMFVKVELTEQELYTVLQVLQAHPLVTSLTKLHMQAVALQPKAQAEETESANP